MTRKFNFSAGPSTLPVEVLEELRDEMVDFKGCGFSLIEASHRWKEYDQVHSGTIELFRDIMEIPNNYRILFLAGGATLQFSMIPLNFLSAATSCDFTISGSWAKKAYADAKKVGKADIIFDGSDEKFTTLPNPTKMEFNKKAAYLHITSNETIQGVQWSEFPDTGEVPLIADMSSDIMSRRIPIEKFALIYAGAQKNLGPAGLTVVIIREDMLERINPNLTAYLDYNIHAKNNSLYNTPPVFSIYAFNRVLEWTKNNGGLTQIEAKTDEKAKILYDVIDNSGGFYNCPVNPEFRSKMNVVFTLPTTELDSKFLAQTANNGLLGLKGHRSIGGLRASIYNAMPIEGCIKLAQMMQDFAKQNT